MIARRTRLAALALLVAPTLAPAPAHARVSRVVVESRERVLEGRAWGEVGAYEKLTGFIYFEFDPANPFNSRIVDLQLAPRNRAGMVEARANFMALKPVSAPERSVALVEVSNRGGKASLSYFNRGGGADPTTERHFGDGFLMRHGFTVLWVGWQFDVPDRPGNLKLEVPHATLLGKPIEGLVRSDWTNDRPTKTLALGHRNHWAYPVLSKNDPRIELTVRDGRDAERRVVSRDRWRFARQTRDGEVVESDRHVYAEAGFEPGKLYELVYPAKDPRIVGLGPAAIRDVISHMKHDDDAPFPAEFGVAFGVSQTGRFLRHFTYQGFNTDEMGRKAYDGLLAQTAGAGRGSFNHRFAQPSRDAHRYSAFFYPTDIFPFSGATQTDPRTGQTDGLLAHQFGAGNLPKVFYTNTGYEYWGRAASLLHTTPDGARDVPPLASERVYHLAGAQHFVGRFPQNERSKIPGADAYRNNPVDFLPTMRALLLALRDWARGDALPPESAYPRIDRGQLVAIDKLDHPTIPGLERPTTNHVAYRADYGPRWSDGAVDFQPPRLGLAFSSLVAQLDDLGNEAAGVRGVELRVPLGTYYPWSLRTGAPGGAHELTDFLGTHAPLALTEKDRENSGDSRPSVEALYASKSEYMTKARRAARALVARGFLLEEDLERVLARAGAHWDWLRDRGQ